MTGSLPYSRAVGNGHDNREYPKRWRDRVQRRGIGDRERHESAVTAVYRAGLDDRGFERSEKPVPFPEGTRGALDAPLFERALTRQSLPRSADAKRFLASENAAGVRQN